MALGKEDISKILEQDREYGFSSFENNNLTRLANKLKEEKNWNRYEAVIIKQETAQDREQMAKNFILSLFEKLRLFR